MEHVENIEVFDETHGRELFLKTSNQREQRFFFCLNMLRAQRFLVKYVEESCFQKQVIRENIGLFILNMFRVQRFLVKHIESFIFKNKYSERTEVRLFEHI